MEGKVSFALHWEGRQKTYAVVDLLAAETTNVLDHGGDLCGPTEENEHLVNRVCRKIVREAVRFQREVLPRSLEFGAEAVKPNKHMGQSHAVA